MGNKRNVGIDLLRIVLTFFICIFHAITHGGIQNDIESSLTICSVWSMRSVCACCVNGYGLISGYCANQEKMNYKRIVKLWFIALFYSAIVVFLINSVCVLIGFGEIVSYKNIYQLFMPVTYGTNWYFSAYFALFFIMPFINRGISFIKEREAKKTLIVFLFIYLVFPYFFQDNFYLNDGLSPFWILLLYCIGVLLKKANLFSNTKITILFCMFIICSFISFLLAIFVDFNNPYISPFVLLQAVFLLILFSRLKFNEKIAEIISFISSLTFGAYMFHDNEYVRNLFIEGKFVFVGKMNFLLVYPITIGVGLLIFLISILVDYIRSLLFKLIKMDNFIDFITNKLSTLLDKITLVLK